MTLHSQTLSPDWKVPQIVQRGVTTPLGLRLRDAGTVVTALATAISVDVYTDSGETDLFVSSGALTPADTTEYDLVTTASTDLSMDWVARWSDTYAGREYTHRQRVCIVGTMLSPRLDVEDLYTEEPDLRHAARLPAGQTSWSPQILAGWYDLIGRLTRRGAQPWLSVDLSDVYQWHLYLSLVRACSAIPSAAGSHYAEAAARYRAEAHRRELQLTIEYETTGGTHTAAGPSVIPLAPRGRPAW